jgi:N utilization substance protein A
MEKNDFDIKSLVSYVEVEYGMDRETVISTLELCIQKAARKNRNFTSDLKVEIDRNTLEPKIHDVFVASDTESGTGIITLRQARLMKGGVCAEEGELVNVKLPMSKLGRIVARESRMLILQKIREFKTVGTIRAFKDRVGEIVHGTVSGIDHGNITVTVGNSQMILPKKERILKERYKVGDSISALVKCINERQKGSPVVLSRAGNGYLDAVMHLEVSEIADGDVEIVGIARDPGFRAKVAVKSNSGKIDPAGACIGRRGIRINRISNEMSGERIDVVKWSSDTAEFIRETISPARAVSIAQNRLYPNTWDIVVNEDQYPVLVGRGGQNIRLAQELVGAKLNVRKSTVTMSFEEQCKAAVENLSDMLGISKTVAETIVKSGYLTADGIASDDLPSFIASTGLDEVEGAGIHAAAEVVANDPLAGILHGV